MPAPSVLSTTFRSVASADPWTVNGPDTVDLGDLLLVFLIVDDTQLIATGSTTGSPGWPSGFTELQSGVAKTAGGDCSGYAAW